MLVIISEDLLLLLLSLSLLKEAYHYLILVLVLIGFQFPWFQREMYPKILPNEKYDVISFNRVII